jgi:2-keto-4-pentenoate hydratase/2-oxohepta-3-ene-1,7-dioic acid hydratase in catechol pathway
VLGSGTCGTECPAEIKRTQPGAAPGWLGVGDGVRIEVEEPGMIENRLVPARIRCRCRAAGAGSG